MSPTKAEANAPPVNLRSQSVRATIVTVSQARAIGPSWLVVKVRRRSRIRWSVVQYRYVNTFQPSLYLINNLALPPTPFFLWLRFSSRVELPLITNVFWQRLAKM